MCEGKKEKGRREYKRKVDEEKRVREKKGSENGM